ncbi:helix-turn-helix domain-containing protein [Sphingomonas sp. MMS24-JH45]
MTHDRHPTSARARQTDNFLLQNLSAADFGLLEPHLDRVPFHVGDTLARAGEAIDRVYFPEGAIAGILAPLDGEHRFAVALVGQEVPRLAAKLPRRRSLALRGGDAGRGWPGVADAHWRAGRRGRTEPVAAPHAAALYQRADGADGEHDRVVAGASGRTADSALDLLYHDRVRADKIMTHEEFRLMLGVRRSSVTDALHRLEDAQAVRTARGRVVVVDRSKLMALAGETYGRPEREYRRLIIGNAPAR